jgi:hypothetical protein
MKSASVPFPLRHLALAVLLLLGATLMAAPTSQAAPKRCPKGKAAVSPATVRRLTRDHLRET